MSIDDEQMQLEIVPMDAALGAEVRGVDLPEDLSSGAVDALAAAWTRYQVLVFRGQRLSDDDLLAFSRRFGTLEPPGPNPYGAPFLEAYPEINVISNIVENSRPIGGLGAGEAVWHADMTYVEKPPMGAILYAIEIPPSGGHTYFANMFAAYEALPEALKSRIDGRVAIHDASHNSAGLLRKGYQAVSDVRRTSGARHPLVRTEPGSGRRCLFLGRRPRSYILGLDVCESESLLDRLWDHATQARFVFRHEWRSGDVLMWKNLSVLHRRDAFDADSRRLLHRTQIKGEETIA
jgi:taurine dioxygenase